MMINGEEFFEDAGRFKSPKCRYAIDGAQVTRSLQCKAVNHDSLDNKAKALLGLNKIMGGSISRQLPHHYPTQADEPVLYATEIPMCDPDGIPSNVQDDGITTYPQYTIQVIYTTLPYFVKEDAECPDEGAALASGWVNSRFVSKTIKRGSRIISIRQGLPRWDRADTGKDGDPIPEGFPYTQYRHTVEYGHHFMPLAAYPKTAIHACTNCVNDASFDGYPAGTLAYTDTDVRHFRDHFGGWMAEIKHIFIFSPGRDAETAEYRGWNSLLRVVGGKIRFWRVTTDGKTFSNTNAIVKQANFTTLFKPEP